MRVFFLLFLYFFLNYFVLPVCCFVPEFLFFSSYRSACYWACSRSTWRQKSRMTSQWETTSGSSTRSTSTITSQSGEGPSKTGGRGVKKAPLTQSAFFNYFPTVFCSGTKLLNILNSNWWRIFLKWKWRRINNYMWSQVFYRYNDPRG